MPTTREKTNAALAIDLGSTRFKLGCANADGNLTRVDAVAAPQMSGTGLVREIDAVEFLGQVDRLLDTYPGDVTGLPLGLVCQRSTFLVWDRGSGRALTPVISWQDRRAADWCELHRNADELLRLRAGLLMSPHYAGPKLAAMLGDDPDLAAALHAGDAVFGNLDAWLAWMWTNGASHRTDLTMAARTAMVDISVGDWSDELLDLYRVPRKALPEIVTSDAASVELKNGLRLTASIADQGSGVLAVLDPAEDAALVNLGTGGFVLRPISDANVRIRGYLTAPILASRRRGNRHVLEGTINGAGPAVDRFGAGPSPLPAQDPCPEGFAIPDLAGIGAPHWRPELGLTLSSAIRRSADAEQRRVVIEGLLFRIFEILRDVGDGRVPEVVYLSGGLAREPGVAHGLASLLGQPVHVFDEPEATLLGAARLALDVDPFAAVAAERIDPSNAGAYLPAKFPRWSEWLRGVLAEPT